jgi:hypothetical protein
LLDLDVSAGSSDANLDGDTVLRITRKGVLMTAELSVAMVAVLVSVLSFVANHRAATQAERHGRMPVLVVSTYSLAGITVRNLGRGPALNILLATGPEELGRADAMTAKLAPHRRSWANFKHLRPIEAEDKLDVPYPVEFSADRLAALGLRYTDALGKFYTVLSSPFGTKVFDGSYIDSPPFTELPPV